MQFMRYCICFLALEFPNQVKGQQYNLTGSLRFALLREAFTWTCDIYPSQTNAIQFKRNNNLSVVLIQQNEECSKQSANPRYTYGCQSRYEFTLTIPAENMTEYEQKSEWICENVFDSSFKSSQVVLNISIDVYNVSLYPNDNPLTIKEDAQIEFLCIFNTNAVPTPTITWHLGSADITSRAGADTTSITITVNRTDNTKTLQCGAKNSNKPQKTANTTLNVEYPPKVNTLTPKFQVESTNLSVNCNITPGNPSDTKFYWTKEGNQRFQEGQILQLFNIRRENSGTYICKAENIYSTGGTGTHTGQIVISVLYPPTVHTFSEKNIEENKTLLITCNATSGIPNTTSFFWTKVDKPGFRQNGSTLHLPNIQRTSSGTYRCTAENNYIDGKKGTHSQLLDVNVLYPPFVQSLSQQNIIEGRDLSVNCSASPGYPNSTTVYWTKVDNPTFSKNGATLLLPNIDRNNSGNYRCTAENSVKAEWKGTHSQTMVVNVLYHPTIKSEQRQLVNESQTVILTRDIYSNPLSNVSWYYKSELLERQTSVTTAVYKIEKAMCTDTKNFTLVARNGIGNYTSDFVELVVNCKPMPNENDITLIVTETIGIEFSIMVIAYPVPSYELQYENGTKSTQMVDVLTWNALNNFTIQFNQSFVSKSDLGTYNLKVENMFGEANVIVNVIAQRRPDIPRNITATCEGTGARIQWKSSFNGGDHQTFMVFAWNDRENRSSGLINDRGEDVTHNTYIQNLKPFLKYSFYVSAKNRHGYSSSDNVTCTTSALTKDANLSLIAGGAVAGGLTLAIIVIVIVILLRRYMKIDKQTETVQRLKLEDESEDTDDNGLKDNILYVSAGPKADEKTEAAVYASVNKKAPESNDNSNLYAEINKSGKNDTGKVVQQSDDTNKKGLLKKDVCRKKDKNPKQKKGKKQKSKQDVTDVYENSEDIAMSSKSDNVYSNTGQKVQNKEERGYKNKDGLLYVEVQFDAKTEKGNQTIHGEDEKTDYATVEFPMDASRHDE